MKIAIIIPLLAILSAVALFVGAVFNADAGHHSHKTSDIIQMDIDNDGRVSFEEYEDFHIEKIRWSFKVLDLDNDGFISAAEWKTFLKMHGVGKYSKQNEKG